MVRREKHVSKKAWKYVDMNVLGVTAAALLLSYSFSFAPPTVVAKGASAMLGSASVGMSAAVDENPFNTLAQQLVEKERELQGRESGLDQREALLLVREAPLAVYSFILALIVSLLVLVNFYFDWRGRKKLFVVDARRA